MTHKTFKNEHDKKEIHLKAIKANGSVRVFSFEVADALNYWGYSANPRIVGQYLSKLEDLDKEFLGGRWVYSLNNSVFKSVDLEDKCIVCPSWDKCPYLNKDDCPHEEKVYRLKRSVGQDKLHTLKEADK